MVSPTVSPLYPTALNEDLCTLEFADHFVRKAVGKTHEIGAGSILQIQQVSNISLPKQDTKQNYDPENQVLKMTLTDGDASVFAIVLESLTKININTPPGTKIKISQTTPLMGQIFLLTKNNHQVIGGNVPKMVEKWNFQRKMDIKQEWGSFSRMDGPEGPPLWRPLGQKPIPLDISALRKMKAMDIVNEKNENAKEGDETQTQFDVQRNEAISELMEKSVKQKWQKPNKHLLDKELLDIMDEGFSMEEASEALRKFKNPQKALKFLKGRSGDYDSTSTAAPLPEERKERKSKRNSKMGDIDEDDAPIPKEYQRPTRNISLFGFIADHIKVDETADTDAQKTIDLTNSVHKMDFRDSDRYENGARGRGRGYGRSSNPRHRGSNFPPNRGRIHYEQEDRAERTQSGYNDRYEDGDRGGGRGYERSSNPRQRGNNFLPNRGRNHYEQDDRAERSQSGYNDRYEDGDRGGGRGYERSSNPHHRGSNFPPNRGRNQYEQEDRAERSQSGYNDRYEDGDRGGGGGRGYERISNPHHRGSNFPQNRGRNHYEQEDRSERSQSAYNDRYEDGGRGRSYGRSSNPHHRGSNFPPNRGRNHYEQDDREERSQSAYSMRGNPYPHRQAGTPQDFQKIGHPLAKFSNFNTKG